MEYKFSLYGKTFPVYTPEIIEAVRESVRTFNKGFVVNQSFKIGGDDKFLFLW